MDNIKILEKVGLDGSSADGGMGEILNWDWMDGGKSKTNWGWDSTSVYKENPLDTVSGNEMPEIY